MSNFVGINGSDLFTPNHRKRKNKKEKEAIAFACKNTTFCNRAGILVFDKKQENCLECGMDLFVVSSSSVVTEQNTDDIDDDIYVRWLLEQREKLGVDSAVHIPQVSKNDTFHCPSDLTGCPIAHKAIVHIPLEMFNKWVFLAEQIDTEWIAYLKGEEVAPGEYEIAEMYFPNQKANATHVEAADGEIQPGTIGAVHSHVGMNVFFSGEDVLHMNHKIELVVNRKGEIVANGRVQLECGRYHRDTAEVMFIDCDEELELVEQLKLKIMPDIPHYIGK